MIEKTEKTIEQKLQQWERAQRRADVLKAEIEAEVLATGDGFKVSVRGACAAFSNGRGSYDYESMAKDLEAPKPIIKRFSRLVVDWRLVCQTMGMTDESKQAYYTEGNPSASVKLT